MIRFGNWAVFYSTTEDESMCEKPNNAYCLRDKINAIDHEIELERIVHNKRKNALNDERDKLVAELYKEGFSVVVSVP